MCRAAGAAGAAEAGSREMVSSSLSFPSSCLRDDWRLPSVGPEGEVHGHLWDSLPFYG